jgi:hypothetical protein
VGEAAGEAPTEEAQVEAAQAATPALLHPKAAQDPNQIAEASQALARALREELPAIMVAVQLRHIALETSLHEACHRSSLPPSCCGCLSIGALTGPTITVSILLRRRSLIIPSTMRQIPLFACVRTISLAVAIIQEAITPYRPTHNTQ